MAGIMRNGQAYASVNPSEYVKKSELDWNIKDINLSCDLTAWNQTTITVNELINAKEVKLYDSINNVWTNSINYLGYISTRIFYTNGLGYGDGYMFSQMLEVNFNTGEIYNITVRNLTTTSNYPVFTKVAYR